MPVAGCSRDLGGSGECHVFPSVAAPVVGGGTMGAAVLFLISVFLGPGPLSTFALFVSLFSFLSLFWGSLVLVAG